MAPHSSTLAWKIPWSEEPSRLQSMGSRRVGHDWATSFSLFPFMHWRQKWQPTLVFLPGESQGQGSLVGCHIWGCIESDTTEWLSSSSYLISQKIHVTRLPCTWDSPGKNTGVGCHFLLQCMKVKSENEVAQSCPTLSDSMDCCPPGSTIHGIFQTGVLEWGAIAFSKLLLSMQ